VLVALQADVADPGVWEQLEHGVNHSEAGSKDGHHHHVRVEHFALGGLERRFDPSERHRQLASGLERQGKAQPMGQAAEVTGRRGAVPERQQRILHDGVLHDVNGHA
jgi:hypothetical protein